MLLISKNESIILKGIAIFIIVIGHIGCNYTRLMTPMGGVGVSLFLILSGYGLSLSFSKNGYKHWLRKRVFVVFIPYWIVQIISYFFLTELKIQQVLLDLSLIKPLHPLGWYLNYLMLWYLTFFIVQFIRIEKIQWVVYILLAVLYAVYFEINSPIRFEQSLSFVAGCFFAKNSFGKFCIKIRFIIVLFILATLCLGIKQIPGIREHTIVENFLNLFIKFFYAMTIIFFVLLIGEKQQVFFSKFFFLLGTLSYEIYLVHGYTLHFFECIDNLFVAASLFIFITIAGILVLYILQKKILKIINR